jgi:hypothetical protein
MKRILLAIFLQLVVSTNAIAARVYYVPDISVREGAWCDPRSYGAIGDGVTDDSAAVILAVAAAANNTVRFAEGTYVIDDDVTVPANVTLYFTNGGILSVAVGRTFTINGAITAPPSQIFSGAGDIAGSPLVDFVRPEWWGAVGDGSTNCSDGIDKAIKFASEATSSVQVVRFLPGVYSCESALSYDYTHNNVSLIGAGDTTYGAAADREGGTKIVATNIATATPFITIAGDAVQGNVKGWHFRDLQIVGSGTLAKCAVRTTRTTNLTMTSVDFRYFTDACVFIDGSCWLFVFTDCKFTNAEYGVDGIGWILGFRDSQFSACTYGIGVAGNTISITGCDLEGSDYGINSIGVNKNWVVENCYFESMNVMAIYLRADGSIFGPFRDNLTDVFTLNNSAHNVILRWYGDLVYEAGGNNCHNNLAISVSGTVTDAASTGDNYTFWEGGGLNYGQSGGTFGFIAPDGSIPASWLQAYDMTVVDDTGTPTLGSDLVINGGFDSDTSGWTPGNAGSVLSSEAGGQSGNCLKITHPAGSGYAYQTITVDPGAMYTLTWYTEFGDVGSRLYIGTTQGGLDIYNSGTKSDVAWTQYSTTFRATVSTVYISLSCVNVGYVFFDTVTMKRINTGDLAVGNSFSIGGNANIGGVLTPGSLIIPSGITPTPDTEGALFMDTDESANGSLMMYGNGAWRKVMDLP